MKGFFFRRFFHPVTLIALAIVALQASVGTWKLWTGHPGDYNADPAYGAFLLFAAVVEAMVILTLAGGIATVLTLQKQKQDRDIERITPKDQ